MNHFHLYKRCLRVLVGLMVVAVPAASLAEDYLVVQGGSLNLRQEASLESSVLGQYPTGTWMQIIERGREWTKVLVNGKEGYVMDKYLTNATNGSTMYVRTNTGRGLNLRDTPSTTGNIITSFAPGTAVEVTLRGSGWYGVEVEGKTGYMSSQYLSTSVSGGGTGTTGYPKQGVVSNPGSNQVLLLRETASTDAKVLGYFGNGTNVTLHGTSGNFYKVTVNGVNGYMMQKYITVTNSGSGGSTTVPTDPFQAKLVNPNGNSIVNFRSGASLSAPIIKAYPVGTEITVTELGDVWCKVTIDGQEGYVSRYFFEARK